MIAVQMDLARQKENMEEIKRFFDLAADHGFDTVVLYLEDRIKTRSYAFAEDHESYSPQQIGEMVAYASARKLELIPVVSNLGHVERFLRHKELAHLSETRHGDPGRFQFTDGRQMSHCLCPSLEVSYVFFDAYIAEVAQLFPSAYFHVGLDESWDMGLCDLCKKRFKEGGLSHLFETHILRTHKLLQSLGKTMLMWDDMFEYCPRSITRIPRDIVLCSWNYSYVERKLSGHFNNSYKEDLFDLYERLGFQYIASSNTCVYNVESFTRYAARYKPLGMLATIWEKGIQQLYLLYPLVANAGMLWNGILPNNPVERLARAIQKTYNITNKELIHVVSMILSRKYYSDNNYFSMVGARNKTMDQNYRLDQSLLACLEQGKEKEPVNQDMYAALEYELRRSILAYKAREIACDVFDYRSGVSAPDMNEVSSGISQCIAEAKDIRQQQIIFWNRRRQGIASDHMVKSHDDIIERLQKLLDIAKTCAFGELGRLDVTFFLPDQSCGPRTKITLWYDDGNFDILPLASYKYLAFDQASFTLSFPIQPGKAIEKCTVEVLGYGRGGITYLEAFNRQGLFVPNGVGHMSGKVENAHHVLKDDSTWCCLGEADMLAPFRNPAIARLPHSMDVLMTYADALE
jgi:hypothetical protein